jgi:hypothetical protein
LDVALASALAIGVVAGAPRATPVTLEVTAGAGASAGSGQSAMQRRVQDYLVTFEVTESTEMAAGSVDQVTILFSNRVIDVPAPPSPVFGDDILAEFSFSGLDVAGGRLRFSRRVPDRSFLEARYVRVVNSGGDGWGGATLTMAVDGEPVLTRVDLTKRKGQAGKGLQDWNRKNWRQRTYWEGELQALARPRMKK